MTKKTPNPPKLLEIFIENQNGRNRKFGNYKCWCGNEFKARVDGVNCGSIVSCGCSKKSDYSYMVGKKYNKLTTIKLISNNTALFRCECGKEKVMNCRNVEKGISNTCGCKIKESIIGKTFGQLKVICLSVKTNAKKEKYYVCECECGNICDVSYYSLIRGQRKNCFAIKHRARNLPVIEGYDLINQRFGNLIVEKLLNKRNTSGSKIWLCRCDCGEKREVDTNRLTNGRVDKCNKCSEKDRIKKIFNTRLEKVKNHIGEKFERLTIINVEKTKKYNIKDSIYCICKCDCGTIVKCKYRELELGIYKSCGCFKIDYVYHKKHNNYPFNWYFIKDGKRVDCRSGYEVLYANYLIENKIQFEYEPKMFKLDNNLFYIPDFYIVEKDLFVEIKGILTEKNKIKYNEFMKTHKLEIIQWDKLSKLCGIETNYSSFILKCQRKAKNLEEYFATSSYKEFL